MTITQQMHDLGQSLWLDNITRDLLDSGALQRYVSELSLTGLTSNPTIFDHPFANTPAYDVAFEAMPRDGPSDEEQFVSLALEDLCRAADIFGPATESSAGTEGWVSMEVSPLLANDTAESVEAAARMLRQAARPNLFVKIPGTSAGLPAIEESLRGPDGEWLRLKIDLPGYPMLVRAWHVQVGRNSFYLPDSNDAANVPALRGFTSELYGGGPELRLQQELLLGIGGRRLLAALTNSGNVHVEPHVDALREGQPDRHWRHHGN